MCGWPPGTRCGGRCLHLPGEQHQLLLSRPSPPPVCCRLSIPFWVPVLRHCSVGEASPWVQQGRELGQAMSSLLVRVQSWHSPVAGSAAVCVAAGVRAPSCRLPPLWPRASSGPALPLDTSSLLHGHRESEWLLAPQHPVRGWCRLTQALLVQLAETPVPWTVGCGGLT